MGTRSFIIAKIADNKWKRIYCHWDGYLDHNGRILFDHYTSQKQVNALMALGDISSLAPSTDKPEGHTFGNKVPGYTVAYGRDRGETGTEGVEGPELSKVWSVEEHGCEFVYVWDGEKWWVGDPDESSQTLVDLGDALSGKKAVTPAVKAFGVDFRIGKHAPLNPKKPGVTTQIGIRPRKKRKA